MIVVELMGGLGNQMFQYAIGRHLALLNQTDLYLDSTFLMDRGPRRKDFVFRNYDLDLFDLPVQSAPAYLSARFSRTNTLPKRIWNRLWPNQSVRFVYEKHFHMDEQVLSRRGDMYLDGYWQSARYFDAITDVIRADFRLSFDLPIHSQQLANDINNTNAVCLNVRRADFVTNPVHGTTSLSYYQEAVTYINANTTDPIYYVFSDDIDWCINNLHLQAPTVYVGHEYAGPKFGHYLQLMHQCQHFIIPNSTFAWWAAWLSPHAQKIVVAPKQWFGKPILPANTKDLIPPLWVRL